MAAFLDHIGIAVTTNSKLAQLLEILGLPITDNEVVEREQVNAHWVALPLKPTRLELLQGTAPDSTISKYLAKNKRDGIHHLSFRVDDITKAAQNLTQAGFQMVYSTAKPGADHCLVNFVHPSSTGGLLIELSQR